MKNDECSHRNSHSHSSFRLLISAVASDGRRLLTREKQTLSFSQSNRCAPKKNHVDEADVIITIRIDTNSTMNLTQPIAKKNICLYVSYFVQTRANDDDDDGRHDSRPYYNHRRGAVLFMRCLRGGEMPPERIPVRWFVRVLGLGYNEGLRGSIRHRQSADEQDCSNLLRTRYGQVHVRQLSTQSFACAVQILDKGHNCVHDY